MKQMSAVNAEIVKSAMYVANAVIHIITNSYLICLIINMLHNIFMEDANDY